ncbi:2-acylglycerol O-acyltransferase 2-like isoform X3 [Phaenicophaeus curvirostris]|uniref:2-acylglycerol O-acyltransferase 2-like isoform X3 n=1 Tax=Phaenicophaeus curvirostris TaxID=33595 RepID=UPI0037F0CF36
MPLRLAPLRLPLRRRLQTLAVLQWVFSFLALGQLCTLMFVLALRGSLWVPALLYGLWLLADRDTPRRGGRSSAWVRGWTLWHHFRDYFPISLIRTAELDPRRNYLLGFHPHGVLAAGAFANFCTEATGFGGLFPGLHPHLLTLPCWFRLPLFRDYMLAGGLVSSEKSSLEFLLSREGGGQAAVIALGGPPESLDAHPGALTLQLLGRKGFVRIALEHGTSCSSRWRTPPARGSGASSCGSSGFWVGSPLELPRTPNPPPEAVELWHRRYLKSLSDLFEEHKLGYGVPPDRHLSFV